MRSLCSSGLNLTPTPDLATIPEPEPEPPQQEPVQQDDGGCIGDDAEILW